MASDVIGRSEGHAPGQVGQRHGRGHEIVADGLIFMINPSQLIHPSSIEAFISEWSGHKQFPDPGRPCLNVLLNQDCVIKIVQEFS